MDIRKILIIFVVGILFSVLVFSAIDAAYPRPQYEDFCPNTYNPRAVAPFEKTSDCPALSPTQEEFDACNEQHGNIEYTYDSNGCATAYSCSTCSYEFEQSNDQYNLVVFYVSALLSLIAIFVGLYLPAQDNSLNEWIGTGFMLGGVFSLFFGTIRSFSELGRFTKPIVMLLELALVIFMAYKKVGNLKADKKT